MVGSDYDHLLASVKREKRLRYSVIVYEGMILDGNQRLRACREARVEPKYTEFEGTAEKALDMVMDLNLARRQLTQSQKANAVAKATLLYEQGARTDLVAGDQVTKKLADKAVGMTTVKAAKRFCATAPKMKRRLSKPAKGKRNRWPKRFVHVRNSQRTARSLTITGRPSRWRR